MTEYGCIVVCRGVLNALEQQVVLPSLYLAAKKFDVVVVADVMF